MLTRILSKTDKEMFGADLLARVDYNDLIAMGAAANNSSTPLALVTVPKGFVVSVVAVRLENEVGFDFSDTGIDSLTLKIGDGGDDDRHLTVLQLAEDGTEIEYFVPVLSTSPYAYLVEDTVDAIFTVATGGSPLLSETTSGAVLIYLRLDDLNQLPTR
jgi:hypothetical protein